MPITQTATNLETIIETWRPKLHAVDSAAAHAKPSSDRWAISEVIGHLVDSACNNHQRFVRMQFCEELTFPKYDQNEWAAAGAYREADWPALVDLWYFYNRHLAVIIRNIPEASLSARWAISPEETVTLEFLVTDYLDHLNHHLKILEERITT